MKIAGNSQDWLRVLFAQHQSAGQTRRHLADLNTSVETTGSLGEMAPRVFALTEGAVAPTGCAFDVPRQYVELVRAGHSVGRPSVGRFQRRVGMLGVDEAAKAVDAVAVDPRVRRQVKSPRFLDTLIVKATHRLDDGMGRMPQRYISLHCDLERPLVRRAAAGFAAVEFAAQVCVFDLDKTQQLPRRLVLGLGLHDPVLDMSCRLVVCAQLPHQLKRGYVGLSRGQQVSSQQSGARRQLGPLEDRAVERRCLVPARTALVIGLRPSLESATPALVTDRAEALRPACPIQDSVALGLGTAVPHELRRRQARLELLTMYRHRLAIQDGVILRRVRRKLCDEVLRAAAYQGTQAQNQAVLANNNCTKSF